MANYYDSCLIPKPRSNKKKKACNGYKDKKNRYCYYCDTPYAERHEVYGGANGYLQQLIAGEYCRAAGFVELSEKQIQLATLALEGACKDGIPSVQMRAEV